LGIEEIDVFKFFGKVFVVFYSFGYRDRTTKEIKAKITEFETKLSAIEVQKKSAEHLADFFKSFPEAIPSEPLINYLNNLANQNRIEIISIFPAKKTSKTLYELTTLQMQLAAHAYADLSLFIYDIENSPYAVRIENFSSNAASLAAAVRPRAPGEIPVREEPQIRATLRVGMVELIK